MNFIFEFKKGSPIYLALKGSIATQTKYFKKIQNKDNVLWNSTQNKILLNSNK